MFLLSMLCSYSSPFLCSPSLQKVLNFPLVHFLFLTSIEAACSLNPLLTCSHEGQQISREVFNPYLLWSCGDSAAKYKSCDDILENYVHFI